MANVTGKIGRLVALHVDVQAELDQQAERTRSRIAGLAASHVHSGDYAGSWRVERGKIDRYVTSSDPQAVSKEYGRTGATGRGTSRGVHAIGRALGGEGA